MNNCKCNKTESESILYTSPVLPVIQHMEITWLNLSVFRWQLNTEEIYIAATPYW